MAADGAADLIATGDAYDGVSLWRVPEGELVGSFELDLGADIVDLSSQLGYLAACDHELKVWKLGGEPSLVVHVELSQSCVGLRISPDERRLVYDIGVSSGLIDLDTGKQLVERRHPLDFERDVGNTLAWTSDQRHVLTRYADWVDVRHPRTLAVQARLRVEPRRLMFGAVTLAAAPDGSTFALASPDRISIAQVKDAVVQRTLPAQGARVLEFSPDGSWLGAGLESGTVLLWSLPDFEQRQLEGHTRVVGNLEFAPSGHLVSGSEDDTAIVWELGGAWASTRFERHRDDVIYARLLGEGRDLATVGDNELRLWCVQAQH